MFRYAASSMPINSVFEITFGIKAASLNSVRWSLAVSSRETRAISARVGPCCRLHLDADASSVYRNRSRSFYFLMSGSRLHWQISQTRVVTFRRGMFFISVLNPKGEEALQSLCPKGKTVSIQEWNEDGPALSYPAAVTPQPSMFKRVCSNTSQDGLLASSLQGPDPPL